MQNKGFFNRIGSYLTRWESLAVIQTLCSVLLICALVSLRIMNKISVIILVILMTIALFVMIYLTQPDQNIDNNRNAIVGKGVSLGLILVMLIGSIAMVNYRKNLRAVLKAHEQYNIINYSVIVMANSNARNISDLKDKKIAYRRFVQSDRQRTVFLAVEKEVPFKRTPYYNYEMILDDLYDKEVDAFLINEKDRTFLTHIKSNLNKKTKVIWKFQFKEKQAERITF